MVKSTFQKDLNEEKEIATFLDTYLYNRLPSCFDSVHEINRIDFIHNKDAQYQGIDLTIKYKNGIKINIDEKVANAYFDKNIPTFVLEISYYNKDKISKDGWLFGNQYNQTDSYLLCWGKSHNPNKAISFRNIREIEAFSIRKKDLKAFLKTNYNLTELNFKDKSIQAINEIKSSDKNNKVYLKGNSGPYWKSSTNLSERPLNIICPKYILEEVTKYKFYVQEDRLNIFKKDINGEWRLYKCSVHTTRKNK